MRGENNLHIRVVRAGIIHAGGGGWGAGRGLTERQQMLTHGSDRHLPSQLTELTVLTL